MKKITLIIIAFCFFHLSLSGQNVGIGTSNPAAKLHLNENNGSSVLQKLTTPEAEVILGFNPTNEGILGTVSKHDLRIRTHDINRLNIGSTGNIGIGTITPSQKLQLFDGSFFMSSLGSTNEKGLLFGESTVPLFGWIYDGIGSGSDNQLHLREFLGTPSDILTIKGDGLVGFGTNSPSQKIHVNDGSILLSNLGETESKGFMLGESGFPTYGLIYDGIGSGSDNTLIIREYIGPESDLLVLDANGEMKLSNLEGNNRRAVYVQSDGTITAGSDVLSFSGTAQSATENVFENLHFPEGTKLISIEFRYLDASDDAQLLLRVRRRAFSSGIDGLLISSSSGDAFSSGTTQIKLVNFSSSDPPINNNDFNYSLEVIRDDGLVDEGLNLQFISYRIKYMLE